MQVVVLASGSQYRAQLLSRLGIDFQITSPDIDESAHFKEPPAALARRLAMEKANAVKTMLAPLQHTSSPGNTPQHPSEPRTSLLPNTQQTIQPHNHSVSSNNTRFTPHTEHQIIIASDQVASNGNVTLGKPGSPAKACAQLAEMSGKTVEFFTSLYILDRQSGAHFSSLDITRVTVRQLDEDTIARYVAKDEPMHCAGSFKVESLGISLFSAVTTDDPTALIGLPLIKVCEGLRTLGLQIP